MLSLFRTKMLTQKEQKGAMGFYCKTCHCMCSSNYNYNRHLTTAKHIMLTNAYINAYAKEERLTAYLCDCGRSYKHRQSFYRHRKDCKKGANQDEPKNEIIKTDNRDQLILDLLAQNKELIGILNETVPKIGSNNNNNNHTTNNNQFNLQVFLNEDCKEAINFSDFIETIKVSFADLENQAENGYVKGISKLFIENLQSLGINKRPIHCTDKKRKTLYIKENDAWDKEGSQDTLKKGIQEVGRRTFVEFVKSKEDNAEAYKDADSEFSEKCISIQRSLVPNYPRDTTINKVIENITQNTGIIEK
jgi:hypothetical protein